MTNSAAHIRAVNVSKSYFLGGNEIHALRQVSVTLERGDFVALCGSSGSGKTTLLNLFGCLDSPTQGQIFIGNREINQMADSALANFRCEHLGFIFQTFNLMPVLTALENVEYALVKKRMPAQQKRKLALEALTQVGLGQHHDRRPSQLSGGQRQRVAIARAFVRRPELIIADEPTANLDKATAAEVLDLMSQLNKETKSTVILATHDPDAMKRARRRIDISDGKIL